MDIRKDIFGNTPKVGDTIIYNPVGYKGLIYGKCVGFTKSGLPLVKTDDPSMEDVLASTHSKGYPSVKTGFAIK